MIRQHELEGDRCKHCGALKPGEGNTCIGRQETVSTLAPEPSLRQKAVEDFDTIGARLAELRKERDQVLNQPAEL